MKRPTDEILETKVNDLVGYCRKMQKPIIVSAYDKERGNYWNRTVTPNELDMEIAEDKYPDFLRVLTGFDFDNYRE